MAHRNLSVNRAHRLGRVQALVRTGRAQAWRLHRITRDVHGDNVAERLPAANGNPITALQLRQLSDAIARLTPDQRTVLRLLISGHCYNEIGDLQSVSHSSSAADRRGAELGE